MAEKNFVIYSSTLGTATARPVFEFYSEDETHVPDLAALGYGSGTNAAWVMTEPFTVTDLNDTTKTRTLTVNPTTKAVSQGSSSATDEATDQLEVEVQIETLLMQWDWTQKVDAKITKACQTEFANWFGVLRTVPTNPLWATNPKGIALPGPPAVVASPLTIGEQVAKAQWSEDASVPSQKLALSNWNTLQPVWGFDWDDLTPFATGILGGGVPVSTWTTGRSGERSLRLTSSGPAGEKFFVNAIREHAFAGANGDVFLIEAWVRSSNNITSGTGGFTVGLELLGWNSRGNSPGVWIVGQSQDLDGSPVVSTSWKKISSMIRVDTAQAARWIGVRVNGVKGKAGPEWMEIDNLTVTRLPMIRNAYAKSGALMEILDTAGTPNMNQTILGVQAVRGGSATSSLIMASCRVVPLSNANTDLMRLAFWIVAVKSDGSETILATAAEYGSGQNMNHRHVTITATDDTADGAAVYYELRVSKMGSTGTYQTSSRHLACVLLPRT